MASAFLNGCRKNILWHVKHMQFKFQCLIPIWPFREEVGWLLPVVKLGEKKKNPGKAEFHFSEPEDQYRRQHEDILNKDTKKSPRSRSWRGKKPAHVDQGKLVQPTASTGVCLLTGSPALRSRNVVTLVPTIFPCVPTLLPQTLFKTVNFPGLPFSVYNCFLPVHDRKLSPSHFSLVLRLHLSTLLGKAPWSLHALGTMPQHCSEGLSLSSFLLGPLSGLLVLSPAVALSYVLGPFLSTLCSLPWKAHPFSHSPSLWSPGTHVGKPELSSKLSRSVWQSSRVWSTSPGDCSVNPSNLIFLLTLSRSFHCPLVRLQH